MAVTAAVMEAAKGAAATAAEVMEGVRVEVEMEEAEMDRVGKAVVVTGVEVMGEVEMEEAVVKAEETAEEMVVDVEVATGVEARAGAVRAVEVTVVAATEVEMVAVVTAEEVMARMQESKRGSLLG